MNNAENIQKAHEGYAQKRQSGTMPTYEQKFKAHPTALRAIRLKCIDCMGGSRKAPKTCDDNTCPLWLFRMGKKDKSISSRKKQQK